MAYLDPASNPRSKPQRLCATNCKSSTPDKLPIFRTIFEISCKYMTKNYLHEITRFVLKGNLMQEKSRNLSGQEGEESMIWDKMSCINGWMVKCNLVISLVPYLNPASLLKFVKKYNQFIMHCPFIRQVRGEFFLLVTLWRSIYAFKHQILTRCIQSRTLCYVYQKWQ